MSSEGYEGRAREYWQNASVATPQVDLVSSRVALEVQQPWAQLILSGKKTVETRSYPFPPWLLGRPVDVLQSDEGEPGVSSTPDIVQAGDPRFLISGWFIVSSCFRYDSQREWEADSARHLVSPDSVAYGWNDDHDIYGWVVQSTGLTSLTNMPFTVWRIHRSFFASQTDKDIDLEKSAYRNIAERDFAAHGPCEILAKSIMADAHAKDQMVSDRQVATKSTMITDPG